MEAPSQDAHEVWAEYRKIQDYLNSLPELAKLREEAKARVAPTPRDELYRENSLTVYRYRRDTPATQPRPLLIVPSLVNRPWIMDLLPGESFVEGMLARGFDVFIIEWGDPNAGQRSLDLEHYLKVYLHRAVRRIRRKTGSKKVDLAGYCLGGTLALLYSMLDGGEQVGRLVTMVAPVAFQDEGLLSWWAHKDHFDVEKIVEAHGNVPADFFSSSFPWLVPTAKLRNLRTMYEKHHDQEFMLSFLALDAWLADQLDFPGRVYRDLIVHGYQEDCLVTRGEWPLRSCTARLADLATPTLALAAGYDHVAPGSSCTELSALAPKGVCEAEELPTGHLGIALGKTARGEHTDEYWDRVAGFLSA
jgi:polyhydroxyalkanoate synthase